MSDASIRILPSLGFDFLYNTGIAAVCASLSIQYTGMTGALSSKRAAFRSPFALFRRTICHNFRPSPGKIPVISRRAQRLPPAKESAIIKSRAIASGNDIRS